jgi:hypothetical protein
MLKRFFCIYLSERAKRGIEVYVNLNWQLWSNVSLGDKSAHTCMPSCFPRKILTYQILRYLTWLRRAILLHRMD